METKIKKTLKKVHIGNDEWSCGKINENFQGTRKKHLVIYGPNNSQYDVFGKDVDFITSSNFLDFYGEEYQTNRSHNNKHGNYAIESKLKIYILTHILDSGKNWEFDLKNVPANGKLKTIYDNGTVKNIDFQGMFLDEEIPYHWSRNKKHTRQIKVFGYRKKLCFPDEK